MSEQVGTHQEDRGEAGGQPGVDDDLTPQGLSQEDAWVRWVMETARKWEDIHDLIHRTGIEAVDEDHRRMTEVALQISNLLDLLQDGHLDLTMVQDQTRVLNNLYIGIAGHFEREERIIRRYKLPGYANHKGEHDKFLDLLQSFIVDFKEGRLTVAVKLKSTILEWWIDHINEMDFRTFCQRDWTEDALRVAKTWDDVADLVMHTKIDAIDRERRELIELALKLGDAAPSFHGDNIIHRVFEAERTPFKDLIDFAAGHFAREEAFMADQGFAGYEVQCAEHAEFLEMLERYDRDYVDGKLVVNEDVSVSILSWIVTHTNTTDHETLSLDTVMPEILERAETWEDFKPFVGSLAAADKVRIEDDYKTIFDILFELEGRALERAGGEEGGVNKGAVTPVLGRLDDVVKKHFAKEEQTLRASDVRELQLHEAEHQWFLGRIERLRVDFNAGRQELTRQLTRSLIKWWVSHINDADQRAFKQMAEHGLFDKDRGAVAGSHPLTAAGPSSETPGGPADQANPDKPLGAPERLAPDVTL